MAAPPRPTSDPTTAWRVVRLIASNPWVKWRLMLLCAIAYFGAAPGAALPGPTPAAWRPVHVLSSQLAYSLAPPTVRDEPWCAREEDPQTTNPSYCDQFFACSLPRVLCQMDARTGSYEQTYAGECPACQPFIGTATSNIRPSDPVPFSSPQPGFADAGSAATSVAAMSVVTTQPPQRINVAAGGVQALGGSSITPAISADGRFIAFDSSAANLVPGDANARRDVFVYDRLLAQIERVSTNSAGIEGDGDSLAPAISGDGRFVAFVSQAGNLVAADTNAQADVFVRDRQTNLTERVNVASNGAEMFGGSWPAQTTNQYATTVMDGSEVAISGDGRFVAFISGRPELTDVPRVFVRDRQTSTTKQVSVWSNGNPMDSGALPNTTARPRVAISANGRFVAFDTLYPLVADDLNDNRDVYVHDLHDGTTSRVSVNSAGVESHAYSGWPSISGDGRYVVFVSEGGGLAAGGSGYRNTLVRDRLTGTTTWVPFTFGARTHAPAISEDGRRIAAAVFTVVPPTFTTWRADIVVYDLVSGSIRRVSQINGSTPPDASSFGPAINADGTLVAYASAATNLVASDTNGVDDVYMSQIPANLLINGAFDAGALHWQTFAQPTLGDIIWQLNGGALEFQRPPGSTQAVVLQNTGTALPAHVGVLARFDLGNTANARRRISVLVHDANFGDLSVCTFWLPANAPMRTYFIRTHSTQAWANATISFYAASVSGTIGAAGGFYRVDNVVFEPVPLGTERQTDCVDPTAPSPPGGATGPELLVNGAFGSGLAPWSLFGQIVSQIASGVFEFYRPAGTPAGVVFQATGQAIGANEIVTAVFRLGNSSGVRKRVTVLLHDTDFTDLSACTFWLAPGQPLSLYVMRTFAAEAWTSATISVYPATVGTDQWIRLDDVTLRQTPALATTGTTCIAPFGPPGASVMRTQDTDRRAPAAMVPAAPPARAHANVATADGPALIFSEVLDEAGVPPVTLSFDSLLQAADTVGEVQISIDGGDWITLADVAPMPAWQHLEVDLSAFAGRRVSVRFVLMHPAGDADPARPSTWRLHDVRLIRR